MIRTSGLSFNYGRESVLENINLNISEGRIYGLLGANGAGKSTLLKLITGLLKPKTGTVEIDNIPSFDRNPEIQKEFFYIPEDFTGPDIPVERYASALGAFYPNFNKEQFHSLCREMDVRCDKKFTKLSLGQHKKAIIAIAISLNTRYLFLDEPTNGLDIPSKSEFRKIISGNISDDRSVIISTHQVRDIENLLDDIIIIDNRSVLLSSSMEEIQRKYLFGVESSLDGGVLYSEEGLGGYMTIRENTEGLESKVNIETLFNYYNTIRKRGY